MLFSVVGHQYCASKAPGQIVISEIWSNSKSPVQRDSLQFGHDHAGKNVNYLNYSGVYSEVSFRRRS